MKTKECTECGVILCSKNWIVYSSYNIGGKCVQCSKGYKSCRYEVTKGIKYKQCTVCNTIKIATLQNFYKQKTGLYGLNAQCKKCTAEYDATRYTPAIKTTTKVCNGCKQTYPKTTEFFFKKVAKKGTLMNGYPLRKDSISFRDLCKTCWSKRTDQCNKKYSSTLHDLYIKNTLKLPVRYITSELLDLKRKQLIIYRDVKNKTSRRNP